MAVKKIYFQMNLFGNRFDIKENHDSFKRTFYHLSMEMKLQSTYKDHLP
jgi:hypothetical protein